MGLATRPQDLLNEFVPVRGEVSLVTNFGVFLTIQSRRVFVGNLCMGCPIGLFSQVKL